MTNYSMNIHHFNEKLREFDPNKELQKSGFLSLFRKKIKIKIVDHTQKPPSFIQKLINLVTFKSSNYSKTFTFDKKALLKKLEIHSSNQYEIRALFMEKVCGIVSAKWEDIFQTHQKGSMKRKERNAWIQTIISGLKMKGIHSCPYEKIYCFFPREGKSDIIFGSDGQWPEKLAENLSSEEKAKILILMIPTTKESEERYNFGGCGGILFGDKNCPHYGMKYRFLQGKDFRSISHGKVPESLIKAVS